MPVGTTLIKSSTPYHSAPIIRGGQAAVFAVEVLNLEGGATLDVSVQHKNEADTSWAAADAFPQIATVGVEPLAVSGLKQQVRLEYLVGGTASSDFVHVYAYAPTWRP